METTDSKPIDLSNLLRPVSEDIERVRRRIRQTLCDAEAPVGEIFLQMDLVGGKMLRPALTLLSGRCFGPLDHTHIELAAMMEMIHLASLLHDDVIDQAQTRRGRGSANALWGNTQAVLLGDFVLSRAFAMGAELRLSDATGVLCQTAEAICTGEIQQNMRKGDWGLTEADYLAVIEAKTASLFGACCRLGAMASGAEAKIEQHLRDYGVALGMAFQISDDLLDILGNARKEGKTLGTDLLHEKLTLPVICWLRQGGDERQERLGEWIQRQEWAAFCQTIEHSGAVEYAGGRMKDFGAAARASLAELPGSDAQQSLLGLVSYVLGRV